MKGAAKDFTHAESEEEWVLREAIRKANGPTLAELQDKHERESGPISRRVKRRVIYDVNIYEYEDYGDME